ncbi:MAG TPA: hypothetical protein VG267_18975 [Terracidiphilus sp.]|jgi:hypothetical protein|nr:hypothetical protein [Terracidiphilus sp.]
MSSPATLSLLVFAASLSASSAHTWVSVTGSDSTGTGTPAKPYATFQTAVNNTAVAGVVSVMGPGDYGSVGIVQSVTIDGTGGGNITFTGGEGIFVNPSAAATIVLRNLTIKGIGEGTNAINVSSNTSAPTAYVVNVVIDGCLMEGFNQAGVILGSQGLEDVLIRNSTIVGGTVGVTTNQSSGLYPYDKVTIEHTSIQGSTAQGVLTRNGSVDIRDSVITQGLTGLYADTGANLNVQSSIITGNSYGVCVYTGSTGVIGTTTTVADNTTNIRACGGSIQGAGGAGPSLKL